MGFFRWLQSLLPDTDENKYEKDEETLFEEMRIRKEISESIDKELVAMNQRPDRYSVYVLVDGKYTKYSEFMSAEQAAKIVAHLKENQPELDPYYF